MSSRRRSQTPKGGGGGGRGKHRKKVDQCEEDEIVVSGFHILRRMLLNT